MLDIYHLGHLRENIVKIFTLSLHSLYSNDYIIHARAVSHIEVFAKYGDAYISTLLNKDG